MSERQDEEAQIMREGLDMLNNDFERMARDGELTPVEISIEELMTIADSRGYGTVNKPETDKDFGLYFFSNGKNSVIIGVKSVNPNNDRAIWLLQGQVDSFRRLFMGSGESR